MGVDLTAKRRTGRRVDWGAARLQWNHLGSFSSQLNASLLDGWGDAAKLGLTLASCLSLGLWLIRTNKKVFLGLCYIACSSNELLRASGIRWLRQKEPGLETPARKPRCSDALLGLIKPQVEKCSEWRGIIIPDWGGSSLILCSRLLNHLAQALAIKNKHWAQRRSPSHWSGCYEAELQHSSRCLRQEKCCNHLENRDLQKSRWWITCKDLLYWAIKNPHQTNKPKMAWQVS